MDAFWKEGNFTINRLSFRVYQCEINFLQTLVFYSVNYQSRLDTGWTLYIYRRKMTFFTVGRRLGLLITNIVQTLVFYSRLPGLNRHWIKRKITFSAPNVIQMLVFYSRLQGLNSRKITFSTVGIRLGQLFPNFVQTLVLYSRQPGLNKH